MPLYDYRCTECDREIEVMHGIHDSGPQTCEICGGAMRKALSTPAIHFRGSGWAKKDAAAATAKKAKPKASASGGDSKSSGASDEAKSATSESSKSDTGKTASGTAPAAATGTKAD
jgi:putative FmdB family regulatory protein